MDIKFKGTLALRDGLQIGSQDFILDLTEPDRAYLRTRYTKNYEKDSFILGYKLGNTKEFSELYRAGGSLIKKALDTGIVNPIDWELYQNPAGQYYIEQI